MSTISVLSTSGAASTRVMAAAVQSVPSDHEIADFMGFSTTSAVSSVARVLFTQEQMPVQLQLNDTAIRELSAVETCTDSLIVPRWSTVDSFSQLPPELQSIVTNYLSVDDCSKKVKEFIQLRPQLSPSDPRVSLIQTLIKSNKEYQQYCETLKERFSYVLFSQTGVKNPYEAHLSSADSLRQALRRFGVAEERFSQKNTLAELKDYLQGAFRDEESSIFKKLAVAIVFNDTDRVAAYFRQHQPAARFELIEVMKEFLDESVEEYLINQAFTCNLSLLSDSILPAIPPGRLKFSLPSEEPFRTRIQELALKMGMPMPPPDVPMKMLADPIIPPTLPTLRMMEFNEQEMESYTAKFDAFYKRTDSFRNFRIEMGAYIGVADIKSFIDVLRDPTNPGKEELKKENIIPDSSDRCEDFISVLLSNESDKKKYSDYYGTAAGFAGHVMASFLSQIEQLEGACNTDFSRLLIAENADAKKLVEEMKQWLLSFQNKLPEDFLDVSLENYARFVLHDEPFAAICKKQFHDSMEMMATTYPSSLCTPQFVLNCVMREIELATQSPSTSIWSDMEFAVDRLFQKERCIDQIMKQITNIWNDATISDSDRKGRIMEYYQSIDLWSVYGYDMFDYQYFDLQESLESHRSWLSKLQPANLLAAHRRMAYKKIQERSTTPTVTTWIRLLVDMNIFR